MGLLTKLGLPPPAPEVSPGPVARSASGSGDGNPFAGLPSPFGAGVAQDQVDSFDPTRLGFPVTIAGFTRATLAQRIRDDQEGIAWSLGDVQRQLGLHDKAEAALAPLAAAVEKAMKTPVDKRVAEIHANTSEKMRSMGRDAANARGVVRLTQSVYDLGSELLKNARRQLELARKSLDAHNMTEQAAELRRQAAEIAAAFDLLTDIFEKVTDFDLEDATIAGAGLSMLTWGLKAAAGVDQLNEKADKLEAAAKATQVEVIRENFASAVEHTRALTRQVAPLLGELQRNLSAYHQQRGEVEELFDEHSKGSFRFAEFEKALQAGEKSFATLEQAALEAQAATRRVAAVNDWLVGMLGVEGKCVSHHAEPRPGASFEPDPRKVHEETTLMKNEIRAALKALATPRKRVETLTLGIQVQTGDVLARQQRWLTYCDAAQTALFMAPEPQTGR